MAIRNLTRSAAAAALGMGVLVPVPAVADPLPYGPDTCIQGYVWREARPGDNVCVTPDVRSTVAQQNANPGAHKDPNGAYGPQTCDQGYVWREAFDGDTVCVTPDFRQQMRNDNAAAASRRQATQPQPTPNASPSGSTVLFEVTGSGEVYNIVTDPAGANVADHTTIPWQRTVTVGPDVQMLQVVATGRDTPGPGCRITLDGKVVAEQPVGGSAHCVFSRS
ncbi:MmpS family transport accessory protein [Mycobacterium sp. 141]|uniref:MmpS family transport accessory protein n=1 Tax=Mycobacterium sp. 141 TaxID=1120797 RepID=UPI0005648D20|nr:MmpS family transport accessory protein [Mycobacterium sp. 141]